jgi:FkbM family methyltransferase
MYFKIRKMKLYQNTIAGLRHRHWTRAEAIAYFIKGVARELKIAPDFFWRRYEVEVFKRKAKEVVKSQEKELQIFKEKWLKQNDKESYFDFGICKLPDVSHSTEKIALLKSIFEDTFLFPCFLNDNYDKYIVHYFDRYMREGPYGYTDGLFDVTIKKGDIVIDAGAWIGDFSAYAVSKNAIVYAFEPVNDTFQWLRKTEELNKPMGGGRMYPVQKGLGSSECEVDILIEKNNSGANRITQDKGNVTEKIAITTLDKFVEENKLERVDFIKADIEGAERDMLKGAAHVLKTFAPKLAICTYHLPDDPVVLENLILEANPNYTVVHLRHKLFAAVVTEK